MANKSTYQSNFGRSEEYDHPRSNWYGNRSSFHDVRGRGNFYYQEREDYALNQVGGFPSNQDQSQFLNQNRDHSFSRRSDQDRIYTSNRGRDHSFNTDGGNYSNQSRGYSSHDNFGFRPNQNTIYSSSGRRDNVHDQQLHNDNGFSQTNRQEARGQKRSWGGDGTFGQPVQRETHFEEEIVYYNEQQPSLKVENEVKTDVTMEEDEYDDSDEEEVYDKVNAFTPDADLIEKFKYFPPSAEEMGKIFEGLVIYFLYKVRDVPEKNPFVIICESFRRSNRFAPLTIEDAHQVGQKNVKFCTIRWNGIMMVRGVGYIGNLKEPRVVAGVDLINKLAMTCYTLKMKETYYSKSATEYCVLSGGHSNIVKVVKPEEAPDLDSAQAFIVNFFKDDNDFELFFTKSEFIYQLKGWAKGMGYEIRLPAGLVVLGVSLKRYPQYWRDKILASGKMENERFQLVPPQGLGNDLMKDFDILSSIVNLKKYYPAFRDPNAEKTKYAHNDTGLNIAISIPPWRNRRNRNGHTKRNKKKSSNKKNKKSRPNKKKKFNFEQDIREGVR